jgi:hypothetical protein
MLSTVFRRDEVDVSCARGGALCDHAVFQAADQGLDLA